jgi:hypothetical protein
MTWIRSSSKKSIVIRADLDQVRSLLCDEVTCGKLMPGVETLEALGNSTYHYVLSEFQDGAVAFKPNYEARFDTSHPDEVRWEPHGEHDFRSWGVFRTSRGPSPEEVVLEIETKADADVAIDPILISMVEPFASLSSEQVTEGFLAAIKAHLEVPEEVRVDLRAV